MRIFKLFLVITFLFSFLNKTNSQGIYWQNTIGGVSNDNMISIMETYDGGVICGGHSRSDANGDKTELCRGNFDFWVVKLDSIGNISWQKTIGGSDIDELAVIKQTADGGYIAGGTSWSDSSSEKSADSRGLEDFWIVRLDSVGNIIWQRTIGGGDSDVLNALSQTTDGGFICGGWSNSTVSGEKNEVNHGAGDYWIVKLDSSGNIQWQNTIGGMNIDKLYSLIQTTDGGYICAGESNSPISDDKTEINLGSYDIWILKLNASGNIQWQNTIGGSLADAPGKQIIQTQDGGYVLNGYSNSDAGGDKLENCMGGGLNDYWVLKLDASGNLLWQNTIGGSSIDAGISLLQKSDGGFVLAGNSYSDISGDKVENSEGSYDFWLIDIDSIGITQSQKTIGASGGNYLTAVAGSTNDDYYIGSYSNAPISGDKTEGTMGANDFWLLKMTNRYNHIKGKVYVDLNLNSVQDTNEFGLSYVKISEQNSGRFTFGGQSGNYSLVVVDTGNFYVQPESMLNNFVFNPVGLPVNFTNLHETDSLNDFAFQPTGIFDDLCVTISPATPFRAGMNATYIINYTNVGTTTLSPTVIFYPDDDVSFIYSVPSQTALTADSITYAFGPLSPFQSGQILIVVNVSLGVPIGTVINSGAAILPVAGDVNPGCNLNYWEVQTTGSFDPNDILVNRPTLYESELINPEPLTYIIRFQNTGNDTAFYVRVDNKITDDLQLYTFEFVAGSHPCSIEYQVYDSTMKFTFNNILLPDSNINESESHGFVRYRIKPKTTHLVGDSIRNSAGIYFDYNAPVWTNTAITEIILPLGIGEQTSVGEEKISLYPNPANDKLSINLSGLAEGELIVELYNIYGQSAGIIFQKKVSEKTWNKTFDVSKLRSGMYFVKVSGVNSISHRFVKQ